MHSQWRITWRNYKFVFDFQVVIEAVDEAGYVLSEAVSSGGSAPLTQEFSTG